MNINNFIQSQFEIIQSNICRRKKKFRKLLFQVILSIVKPVIFWVITNVLLLFYKVVSSNSCMDFQLNNVIPFAKGIFCLYAIIFIYSYLISLLDQKIEMPKWLSVSMKICIVSAFAYPMHNFYLNRLIVYSEEIDNLLHSIQQCFLFNKQYIEYIYCGIIISLLLYAIYSVCNLVKKTNQLSIFLHTSKVVTK